MFEKSSWYNELPSDTLELFEPNLHLFFSVMHERMAIWKRRFIDKKERPWTEDRILANSKFTNVYRDLDRNSQWQIKNILLDDELTLKNLIWKLMVFRFFNNPETFTFTPKADEIKDLFGGSVKLISAKKWRNGIPDYDEYDKDEFAQFITGIRLSGQNPYTTAYLINSQATPGHSRDYCYTKVVVPTLHKRLPELLETVRTAKKPEEIIEFLKSLPAVADFIAHEFYQDFTYIPKYINRKFMTFDQNDYTNVGPGASIGIRLIFPNLKTIKEQKQGIYRLKDMAESELKKISSEKGEPTSFVYWDKKNRKYVISDKCNITLHQIEMWLCEFQKYWKMQIGKGKQRSVFKPITKDIIVG